MPSLHNQNAHNQFFSQLDKPAMNTERQNYNNAIAELEQKNYQRIHNSTSIDYSSRLASNEKNIAMSNERNFVQRGDLQGPIFELDHLATFSISSKQGQLKAEDGMRKLRIMEKSSQGIWTMDCQILIDANYLVIYDRKTQQEIEKFPLSLVHDPVSVVSEDKKDIYNNIVLFTVLEDSRKKNPSSPSEMHIFQCNKSHSADIVDEIYKAIEVNPQESKQHQARDGNNNYTKNLKMASNIGMNSGPMSPLTRRATFNTKPDFMAPTRIEMEVQVLNHCFDDIEQFVTKLQNSTESHRELEKRQKHRKSHKKHAGDGILSLRAQMPSQSEYVDIFQKFKHSFNLLAKLRAHIHDPNAPELVHFLFTPLSLIISTIKEQPYRGLSKTVWNPLLTKNANDLLLNCLSSKEQDLWLLLGEAWIVTVEEARLHPQQYGHLENQVYMPVFSDGWTPNFTDNYDNNNNEFSKLAFATAAQVQAQSSRQQVPIQKQRFYSNTQPHSDDQQQKFSNQNMYEPSSGHSSARNPNIRNYEAMKKWAVDLCYRGAKIYEVTHDRPANNEKELTIKVGELLEVLDDKRNWWRLRNFQGEVGHAPVTILRPFEFKNNYSASNNHMGHYDAEKYGYLHTNHKMANSQMPPQLLSPDPCSSTSSSILFEKNLDKSYNDSSVMSPNNSSSYLLSKTYKIQEYGNNEHEASFNRALNLPEDPRQNISEEPYHNILPSRIYEVSGLNHSNQSNESPSNKINDASINRNSTSFGYSSNTSSENNKGNFFSTLHEPIATTPKASYMNQNPSIPNPPVLTLHDQIKQNPKQFLRKTESVQKPMKQPIKPVEIKQNKELIQDEIKQRISKKNFTKEPILQKTSSSSIKRSECLITEKSTPEEVKLFLESKEFSNEVILMFSELTGEQIFMLEKEDFEKYCGVHEGNHLESQIKVQKSLCGFVEQPTSELDKILQKRKQISESTNL